MALTRTQRETLALMLGGDPNPVRGGVAAGYKGADAASTTLASLEGRGLTRRAPAPEGEPKGSRWWILTEEGYRVARVNAAKAMAAVDEMTRRR